MDKVIIDGYPVKNYSINGSYVNNYRPLKLLLLELYKVCYHCGVAVKDYPHRDGTNQRGDSATIDHLKPRQFRAKGEIVEKVLSCYDCNWERNEQIQHKTQPSRSKTDE